ncbi:MAG TPA: glycosyltransferase, partial [Myxococcota bacterium]|nr:glycosyltransferase [Myxococcota bacterium]
SRLARRRLVVFLEEPVRGERDGWELARPARNLLVARPITPIDAPGFDAEQIPRLRPMLRRLLAWRGIGPHTAWLYTPMAWPLAKRLEPDTVIYDCMDELSSFAGAPEGLRELERELLAAADLVFTGGPSLYRAKRALHERVRCVPSSVDAAHFRSGARGTPVDQAAIARPRLGYCGVLDERLDRDLLAALAAARPDWQIVLIGPVAKIDERSLPRHPNLHYLGERRYDDLPSYLEGWDACLLPFALNDATRFISPTKTLEYMAAEKPIISTPIRDVVEAYGDIIYVASAEEFVAACERALHAPADERVLRLARMRGVLASRSWDATADTMLRELEFVERAKRVPLRVGAPAAASERAAT